MKSNKDFFLGVLLVTLHRRRLTYAYTNNTPVNLYWILYKYSCPVRGQLFFSGNRQISIFRLLPTMYKKELV
ncbi:hypothetical protein SCACP_27150 [Sporomusa carbonis]